MPLIGAATVPASRAARSGSAGTSSGSRRGTKPVSTPPAVKRVAEQRARQGDPGVHAVHGELVQGPPRPCARRRETALRGVRDDLGEQRS